MHNAHGQYHLLSFKQQKLKQQKAQATTKAGGQGPEEHYPHIGKACISSKPLKLRKQRLAMNDSNANNGYHLPNVPGGNIGILHFQDSKFCVGDGRYRDQLWDTLIEPN